LILLGSSVVIVGRWNERVARTLWFLREVGMIWGGVV